MENKVLVYCYVGHNNLGDELFIDAYKHLFPNLNLTFTDYITPELFSKCNALFIGGGSFLFAPIQKSIPLEQLKTKPIFYIGVGMETEIHSDHQELLKPAQKIYTRTKDTKYNYMPDIVYSIPFKQNNKIGNKSILFLPNAETISKYDDPIWKHNYWIKAKYELGSVFDKLLKDGYKISILPMCENININDRYAAIEIINTMKNKNIEILDSNIEHFNTHQYIITQRYHGIILAEIHKKPYISIHHHDKLKSSFLNAGIFSSYYTMTKDSLLNDIEKLNDISYENLSFNSHFFEEMVGTITSILENKCQNSSE